MEVQETDCVSEETKAQLQRISLCAPTIATLDLCTGMMQPRTPPPLLSGCNRGKKVAAAASEFFSIVDGKNGLVVQDHGD